MLKNYLKTAIRNLKKNPFYSFINVFGLAVGMACCIMIMLFVQDELSYDRYHENANNIFRITSHWEREGRELNYATTRGNLGPSLVEDYPEIKNCVRVVIHRWFVVEHNEKRITTNPIFADPSILEVFTFPLSRGNKDNALADPSNVVISEDLAETVFGDQDPMGKQIKSSRFAGRGQDSASATVIGVVKDFHNGSLHEEIGPTIYRYWERHGEILLRISPDNVQETLAFLENKWRTLPTHLIFFYFFIDTALENQAYQGDKREGKIFTYAAILAIVLACLGLFGLASYTAERRIKEIGIRKVLGASVSSIILLLNKDFSMLVLIANVVAWPIGYYVMHRWLQDFAYRAGIAWWIFVLAAVMAFVISLLTISYQSIKAAITNPVNTLRYE